MSNAVLPVAEVLRAAEAALLRLHDPRHSQLHRATSSKRLREIRERALEARRRGEDAMLIRADDFALVADEYWRGDDP